jgi:hypothetical protein
LRRALKGPFRKVEEISTHNEDLQSRQTARAGEESLDTGSWIQLVTDRFDKQLRVCGSDILLSRKYLSEEVSKLTATDISPSVRHGEVVDSEVNLPHYRRYETEKTIIPSVIVAAVEDCSLERCPSLQSSIWKSYSSR